MSRERPIPFSAPMVRALLDGSKTQTRRIVKPQPAFGCHYVINGARTAALHLSDVPGRECVPPTARSKDHRLPCPYGVVGDRLWVRETWAAWTWGDCFTGECDEITCAPSEMQERYGASRENVEYFADGIAAPDRWRPSIHMPRWASRITLEITDVRVQRVQDISEEDARAEGMQPIEPYESWSHFLADGGAVAGGPELAIGDEMCGSTVIAKTKVMRLGFSARERFASLWDSISDDNSWATNPWVWALTFKRVVGGAA